MSLAEEKKKRVSEEGVGGVSLSFYVNEKESEGFSAEISAMGANSLA